jgi:hypothetical protein
VVVAAKRRIHSLCPPFATNSTTSPFTPMPPADRTLSERTPDSDPAESIRRAVIAAGEAAYEDAGIQGLCAEGRWEAAVSAMRAVGLDGILRRASAGAGPG